jgi:Putative polyhydroxyalkanoic acid system protein (PHA_gran_rgn)
MTKPLIVTIPHSLGKQEAISRLQSSLGQVRSLLAPSVASIEETWSGDRLDFRLIALNQPITGRIDVMDDVVRVEVMLPWVLAAIAERLRSRIERQGTKMLEKA